jgi:hypothetical protein
MKIERENIEREKTHFNRGDVCWMRKQEKRLTMKSAGNQKCIQVDEKEYKK